MAKVRVLVRSYINNAIREEGEIVDEYNGKIGSNLELVEDKPSKAKPVKTEEAVQSAD